MQTSLPQAFMHIKSPKYILKMATANNILATKADWGS